ncbi:hypothetical protein SAMD00019534_077740 [Acytostelium subglobosum LB1]|uniref:hypothetical protein n=1 Tax=Acytostelium subglobosum LB1 TaxID=1410327 RepID=UPI000644BEF3|nr:hypothetical protein SAMD00019534_077740 [Acytostelium subglobosum LB1]GAM24599.1 hypothetical protein SAMD00019534_077740 [Acytostelium subglobosum LB1]|eukprot:XP_012752268.1 hypothetical protein SAMD00019534_077740 [Acytostelium subglobosum LB1]
MFQKKSPWSSSKGYRLGGVEDSVAADEDTNIIDEEEEIANEIMYQQQQDQQLQQHDEDNEEDVPSPPQQVQPLQQQDQEPEEQVQDDDNLDDDDEEMDMPPPPQGQFPGGMMPQPGQFPGMPPGMMMPPHWGGQHQFQAFGGAGHQLSGDPDDEPPKPKEKDEIVNMITDRFNNQVSPQLGSTSPPRMFYRPIKPLIDICLEKIMIDVTPYQARLKLLPGFMVQRLLDLMVGAHKVTRKKLDQIITSGALIEELNLNYQSFVSNDFMLSSLQCLLNCIRRLSLSRCVNVTDEGAKVFKKLTHLTSLNLSGVRISDVSVPYINKLTSLEELSLSCTLITDKGVVLLSPLVNLLSLDLSNLNITDDCISLTIPSFTKLQVLNLSETQATEKSIQKLSKLPLSDLSLSNCPGIGNQALFFITSFGNTLNRLDIVGTKIAGPGFVNLKRLPNLFEIKLPGRDSINDSSVHHLNQLVNIRKLDLSNYIYLNSVSTLSGLKYCTEMSLSNTKIGDDSMIALSQFLNLEILNLDRTLVTDYGVGRLLTLGLHTFSLMKTHINGNSFQALSAMSSLTSLNVSSNEIEDDKVLPLTKLPNLTFIDLRGTKAFTSCLKFGLSVNVRRPVVDLPVANPNMGGGGDDDDEDDEGIWD